MREILGLAVSLLSSCCLLSSSSIDSALCFSADDEPVIGIDLGTTYSAVGTWHLTREN